MAAKTTNYWRSHLNQNLRTQLSSQASVTIIMSRFQLYAYLHSVYNAIREHILNDHPMSLLKQSTGEVNSYLETCMQGQEHA